jgi:signal transduction histidine kinase
VSSSVELISYQLENSQKSKEIDMIISMIKNQVLRANRMIKNVNILSELEKIDIAIGTIELLDLLKNSINFAKIAYQDKTIEIKVESFSNRIFIKANELLQDIFDNLLINAIKYNNSSDVEIFIKISREPKEDKNYIRMEFIDNGIGIADERKEIIFEKGFREHKGHKGMGLGLSLVKKIVSSYNGAIKVEDRIKGDYSKGSNFILLLLESIE